MSQNFNLCQKTGNFWSFFETFFSRMHKIKTGNSRYGPLHLWSMSLMGHQVVVVVQCNYGPGHLWATT